MLASLFETSPQTGLLTEVGSTRSRRLHAYPCLADSYRGDVFDVCAGESSENLVRPDSVERGHSLVEKQRNLSQREPP